MVKRRSSRKQRKQVRERNEQAKVHGLPRPSLPEARRQSRSVPEYLGRASRAETDDEAEAGVSEASPSVDRRRHALRRLPSWAKVLMVVSLVALALFVLARVRKKSPLTDEAAELPRVTPVEVPALPKATPPPDPAPVAEPVSPAPPSEASAQPPHTEPPKRAPRRSAHAPPARPAPGTQSSASAAGPASGPDQAATPPPTPTKPVAPPADEKP